MSQDDARRAVRRAIDATGYRESWARKAGIDAKTLATFLGGTTWPQGPTRTKIEQALGWPIGALTDIEDGRSIAEATSPPATEPAAILDVSGLPHSQRAALAALVETMKEPAHATTTTIGDSRRKLSPHATAVADQLEAEGRAIAELAQEDEPAQRLPDCRT